MIGQTIDQLETPVATVDLDLMEANIAKFQAYLDEHGVANRPHIKTHKIPAIAHMQVKGGAIGITCQKLGEAEVMAQAGIQDIFLPYNIIGASKLEHLMSLARRVKMSVSADSEFTVRGLSETARSASLTLPVFVECDSGMKRCGVQSPQAAADLARIIARSPGLHFGGLMVYPSTEAANTFVTETKKLLDGDLTVDWVSGGGTPQMWDAHKYPEIKEHRAGMYIYGDRFTLRSGAMKVEECSLKIITTIVSRPTEERGILDGGSKTFSSDLLGLEGHGLILEYPDAVIYGFSEEHGHTDFSKCARKPEIGERVSVIPNHCCVVNNLFNTIVGVRKGVVEVEWPVAARGALQ